MPFKIPNELDEKVKERQEFLHNMKYITMDDKEFHISELEDRSVTTEMREKMWMNSYAQDELPPKLTTEALIHQANYYKGNCQSPRFPCVTYDEALIHRILPEIIKRLEETL